jgi:ABC-type oligopeptide transport system substrate-binding subunit
MKSTNFNINSGKITKEPNPNVQVVDGFADFLTNLFTNFTKQYPQSWTSVKKIGDNRVEITLSSGGGNNLITLLPPKIPNNNIKAYQSTDKITIVMCFSTLLKENKKFTFFANFLQ